MELKDWNDILLVSDLEGAEAHIHFAKELGKSKYGAVVSEAFSNVMASQEFAALVTVLITGNIAFDAKPEADIEIAQGYRVRIGVEAP